MGTKPAPDEDIEQELHALVSKRFAAEEIVAKEIAGGLGRRRFYRIELQSTDADVPASLIARVDIAEDPKGRPAGIPPEPPLEPLLEFLDANKLPVPRSYGGDPARGILLLEDLGSLSLEKAAKGKLLARRRDLYREALAILPKLQALTPPTTGDPPPCFTRRLDEALFRYKADLFNEHALPVALGRPPKPAEKEVVQKAFTYIAKRCAEAPQRLAHRDFQSTNLYLRHDSLPADIQMIERSDLLREIRPQLPDAPDEISFLERFALLTLSRKGKDLARFLYATKERGDSRFQAHIPATVRYLKQAVVHTAGMAPCLSFLAELIQHFPEEGFSCEP